MARETIKSLKEEIEKLKLQMNALSEQNSRLIKQADQEFLNSYVYRELSEKVQFLQNYSKTLENENQRLKDKLEEKTAEIGRLKACTTTGSNILIGNWFDFNTSFFTNFFYKSGAADAGDCGTDGM